MTEWAIRLTVLAQSQNPQNSCCVPCRLGYVISLSFFLAETLQRQNSCSMLWTLMAAMHNVAATTQRTERHVLCASLSQFEESMCIDQRQDIHTACFHCTWQPWKVCMHNKTLSRALWQFTISVEDFQHSSYVCKLGCSLGLAHKGTQVCIMLWTSYQSSGWFASTNDRVSCTCDRF